MKRDIFPPDFDVLHAQLNRLIDAALVEGRDLIDKEARDVLDAMLALMPQRKERAPREVDEELERRVLELIPSWLLKPHKPITGKQSAADVLFQHFRPDHEVAACLEINSSHVAVLKSRWRKGGRSPR